MTADLFFKKHIFKILADILSVLFTVGSIGYAGMLYCAEKVELRKNFFFLVSESTHIEASAYTVALNGGAGYLLSYKGQDYVALSAYLAEEEGERVKAAAGMLEETMLIKIGVDSLYFKTPREKAQTKTVVGALQSLYGCMEVLKGEVSRLDKGATQQSSDRVLETLERQFKFLKENYKEKFGKFSRVCENAEASLKNIRAGTIFVKDLRYLFCELCVAFTQLAGDFSL